MDIQIPEKAASIIERLEAHGYEAYVVGGCVRDSILGKEPEDWDITTSAKPVQVKQIFKKTIDTGIEHGTVMVRLGGEGFEVTTYRIDGEYEDKRHPRQVTFTGRLKDDLLRRDFTINAMAYNPKSGLIDLFGGISDLEQGWIRCVGQARQRFDEDALRILRAVRFAAQLDFQIEEQTAEAIREKVADLRLISAERIRTELVKLLLSPHPEWIHTAWKLGITDIILPEYGGIVDARQNTPNHIYTVDVHTIKALQSIRPTAELRLVMLIHDFGKSEVRKVKEDGRDSFYRHPEVSARMAADIMARLKFDHYTTDRVVRLVKWHGLKYAADEVNVRRALNRVGADIFEEFIEVQEADVRAKNPEIVTEKLNLLQKKRELYQHIIARGQCFSVKGLDINGRDLIAEGIPAGPLLGAVLERLSELVIDDQSRNVKEQLLTLAMAVKDDPTIFDEKNYFFS